MPDWVFLLLDVAIITLTVALLVGHRVLGFPTPPEQGGNAWDAYRVVVSLTALVLAFSLVQAQTNSRNVEAELRHEASTLVEAAHDLQRLGAEAAGLRAMLLDYGRTIIGEEWLLLTAGGRSQRADGLLVALERATRVIAPRGQAAAGAGAAPRPGDFVWRLERLSDLREERITSATLRLPHAFWRALAALVLVTIVLAGAMPWTARCPVRCGTCSDS